MNLFESIRAMGALAVTLVTAMLFAANAFLAAPALADLMVTPKRVILHKGQKSVTLHLLNDSNEIRTYELSWKQMRMTDTGNLKEDKDPLAAGNASSLVVVNPRRVVLAPGESQVVRLRTRLPSELPFGEYISHLFFAPIDSPSQIEDPVTGTQTQIKVLLGIGIPIIVRHGDLSASAEVRITGLDLERGVMMIDLMRQGTASIVGNLEGYWGRAGEPGTLVAQLNNVAVYPNLNLVHWEIPLDLPEDFEFGPGLLHMIYRNPATREVMSQSTIRVE